MQKLYMYDVRGIQNYIFRTNKVKEIVGASLLVEELILNLFKDASQSYKVKDFEPNDLELEFSFDENNKWDAEILYYGGGNLLVLYNDDDIGKKVSREMCIELVKNTYSLQLAVASVDVTGENRYQEDYEALRKEMDRVKMNMPMTLPITGFPITSNDPVTGFPFSKKMDGQKVTYETFCKLNKYKEFSKNEKKNYSDFGKDSRIAIIHIDGNNMGQRLKDEIGNVKTYREAARITRHFSNDIQKAFSDVALKEVEKFAYQYNKEEILRYRTIIHAGDDITFMCDAKIALKCVQIFMDSLKGYTACAGIYITKPHFPFSRGYEFCEELCSNAKKGSRKNDGNFFDFHINYGGILNDIDYIRKTNYRNVNNKELYARPYYMGKDKVDMTSLYQLKHVLKTIKEANIARTQLKELREAFYEGDEILQQNIDRINSRLSKDKKVEFKNKELLFDAIDVLDLDWGDE